MGSDGQGMRRAGPPGARPWRGAAAVLMGLALGAPAARAEFSVCNRTFEIANVAVGWSEERLLRTAGWWTIGPNQCADVIEEPLGSRYVYVFAQDVFGNVMLPGSAPLCVDTKRFEIAGDDDCLPDGYLEALFFEVDTFRSERWTLFIDPPDGSLPGDG